MAISKHPAPPLAGGTRTSGTMSDIIISSSTKSPHARAELERLRQESHWEKAMDLCEQVKQQQNGALDPMLHFLLAEARLESLVDGVHALKILALPDETKKGLVDLKMYFEHILKASLPVEVMRLIRFLLGKIFFMLGDLTECAISLEKGDLANLDMNQENNRRNLKIMAEAFCLKGMCLSKVPVANGKIKRTERTEKVMVNFEVANDVSLCCSQMGESREPTSALSDVPPFILGDLLENALSRAPNMYAKYGLMAPALVRFRDTLRSVETPATRGVRLTLARQLLEMLLRGYLGVHYIDPRMTERGTSAGATSTLIVPRPRRYPSNGGFIPLALLEEVILLLHICEAIIVRDLTGRPVEQTTSSKLLVTTSTAVTDLCTIAFSRLGQIQLGIPFMERAAKSCSTSYHIWKQFAMNLLLRGDYGKALHVLEQCFRLMPRDRVLMIFAAKLCLDDLLDLDRGVKYAEGLCRLSEKSRFSGRARLILGVAYSLKALKLRDLDQQGVIRAKAMKYYLQAETEDPVDFLVQYHLALEYCMDRRLDEAFKHVKKSLRLNMDFLPAYHLLALVLSSSKRYTEALNVLERVEAEFEEEIDVELTKIRLQAKVRGSEDALKSCRHLLQTWKRTNERSMLESEKERLRTTSPEPFQFPTSPLAYNNQSSPLPPMGGPKISPSSPAVVNVDRSDVASYRAESSATLARTEGAFSEMTSTTGSYLARTSRQRAFTTQLSIWVLMAELYMALDQIDNALECLSEAAIVGPPSHLIFHLQGDIIMKSKGLAGEARKYYESALAVHPWYAPSHIQIGRMQRAEKCFPEAERHFREALQGDPCCFEAWASLGELYIEKGNDDLAMEYLEKARRMEISEPIKSFYHLSRCISY